jgi:hypothetical protein
LGSVNAFSTAGNGALADNQGIMRGFCHGGLKAFKNLDWNQPLN